jgi:tripartite-type tricarboxylate transporter receptor subunit TctC
MTLARRRFLQLAAGAAALPGLPRSAVALDYPVRPARIIVGFPAGSASDIGTRLLAQALSERLGQQFLVEDRPGAASNIGSGVVAHAPADGYTLLAVTAINAVNATLYSNLNFDIMRDFAPIAGTFLAPNVMAVNPSVPAKTVPEFIAYAKANPGKLNMASVGVGSSSHCAGALFMAMAGVDLVHVPYRASYFPDLLAGQVQIAFSPIPAAIGYIRAGTLRALGVTSETRSDALPDVAPVSQFVPGYEASLWVGLAVPRKTPAEIVDKLNTEIHAILATPAMKAQLANLAAEPMTPTTPAAFGKFIAGEIERWAKVVKEANMKPE